MDAQTFLGLDLGIASCGWSIIRVEDKTGSVLSMGVRTWDAPENPKEGTPNNAKRRLHRGQRRVIDRRRKRMNSIRELLHEDGLLASADKHELKFAGLDPWRLRVEGLDRRLAPQEFAVTLGHIARHRGFRSNSKSDKGANAPPEGKKMLEALAKSREHLALWRSVGEMIACDPDFAGRKRNRGGDYSRSTLRADLEDEVRVLFARQRALGSSQAGEPLEQRFALAAFTQRPLQDSEQMVGSCPFEPEQMRTARHAPSFERFRLLSRLASLRLQSGRDGIPLSPEHIMTASAAAMSNKSYSFTRLRKQLDLPPSERFVGITPADEKLDLVSRSGEAMPGSWTLKEALGDAAWNSLLMMPAKLDRIAEVVTFRDDLGRIRLGLEEIGLDAPVLKTLVETVETGAFHRFKGAAHISAKAARNILPHLMQGLGYSEACAKAGYDHAKRPDTDVTDIKNPVARKALSEALKQVKAIVQAYGIPDRIHVELARDVGKSAEERDEIERGIEKRNKQKDKHRAELRDLLGRDCNDKELLRYELWKEQNGRCIYTDEQISPLQIAAGDNSVQVDHILPWSRFGDDSFKNKTLCLAKANQDKRGKTPFEWLGDGEGWSKFAARIDTLKEMPRHKKRNYLLRNAEEVAEKFKTRNLNDTRYAARLFLDALERRYPKRGERRGFARPGALTAKLRQAWGLESFKKDADGKRRNDDRHHALDAAVIAATTEARLHALTELVKKAELEEWHREEVFAHMPAPWPGFREDVLAAVEQVFVSRAERHRARGEAHAATIRQIVEREDDKTEIYERKTVDDKFTEKDLARIKDPERNAATVASMQAWIAAGKPKDKPPLSPKGDPIRKVRLLTHKKKDVEVRGGAADRGEMARVDIFRKKSRRGAWEYYAVPIYPHQIATMETPPVEYLRAGGEEEKFLDAAEFVFGLYQNSLLLVSKPDGEIIEGYFRGINRNTVSLRISPPHNGNDIRDSIGFKTLREFRKFSVDRLGNRFEIERETRTWRGKACT